MFPEDIKKFVVDSNQEKNYLKELNNPGSKHRNQDITTKVIGGSGSYGSSTDAKAIVTVNNPNLGSMTTL